jgi:hypothetical protein
MSTDPEKTTFGVTIEPASDTNHDSSTAPRAAHLSTIIEKDSVRSSLAPSTPISRPSTSGTLTPTDNATTPFSTFHADQQPARVSPAVTKNGFLATETDLEAGHLSPISQQTTQSNAPSNVFDPSKLSLEHTKECSMWPTPATLKQQQKQRKQLRRNTWNCWGRLTSRMTKGQKILLQIVIALVVIGAAVGIGVGVSKAVGGGVWSGTGQSRTIPSNED